MLARIYNFFYSDKHISLLSFKTVTAHLRKILNNEQTPTVINCVAELPKVAKKFH